MKEIRKFLRIAFLLATAILAFSCSDFEDDDDEPEPFNGKAKLLLNVGTSSNQRTVFSEDESLINMTYSLKGTISGGSEITIKDGLKYSENGLVASDESDILIDAGKWTFVLTASKNGKTLYQGTIVNRTIAKGINELNFTLSEIPDVSGEGKGKVIITLNFPSNADVAKATVELLDINENVLSDYTMNFNIAENTNSITYGKSGIADGIYIIRFIFYNSSDKPKNPCYSELVQVKAERTSTATRTIEKFEKYYSITLRNIDFEGVVLDSNISLVFNEQQRIPLPTETDIFRPHYNLVGWYDNASCDGNVFTEIPVGTISDKTFYAKWIPTEYNITYEGLEGTENTNPATANIESDITLVAPSRRDGYVFKGWTLNEKPIKRLTEVTGELTLSATWKEGYEFDSSDATNLREWLSSQYGNEPVDIAISRELNSTTLQEIATVLNENKSKKVYLDLSYATGLTELGTELQNLTNLVGLILPESLTNITKGALSGCSALAEITIPFVGRSLTATGAEALFGYIFGTSSYNNMVATKQYYKSGSYTTYYIPTSLKKVTVTGGELSYGAFYNCSRLTSVEIGDSVTSIGYSAFENCSSLTSVEIPDSVRSIGGHAFENCSSLTSVEIGDSVTYIGGYAFLGCSSLTSVTIPYSVTSIGRSAFYNCSSLTSATFKYPYGWWYSIYSDATSGTYISKSDLSNPSTAATYLRSTYYNYYWRRN